MLPRINTFRSLALLLLVLHAYMMVALGATFWYDSIMLASMGHEIWENGLDSFYSGERPFYFGHIGPAAGLVWIVLVQLLGDQAWLGLALWQHGLAWLATLYFLAFFWNQVPRWTIFLAGVVLSMHPFLRAFDNAVLTESPSLSLLLLAVGAGLRMLYGPATRWTPVLLVLAVCVGIQFRNYFVVFGLVIVGVTTLHQLLRTRSARAPVVGLVQVAILGLAYAAFPLVRWQATGEFFLPSCGPVLLRHAFNNNPQPTPEFWDEAARDERLAGIDLRPLADGRSKDGRSHYRGCVQLAAALHEKGMSVRESHQLLSELAGRLRNDNSTAFVNHLSMGAVTIGFARPDRWLPEDHEILRKRTPAEFADQIEFYFRWHSWTASPNSVQFLDTFLRRGRLEEEWHSPAAIDCLEECIRPHVHSRGLRRRDPLRLMAIPMELWALAGLAGLALLLRERFSAGLMLLGIVVSNFAICSYTGMGSIRYFHPILGLYVFCSVYALTRALQLVAAALARRVSEGPSLTRRASADTLVV